MNHQVPKKRRIKKLVAVIVLSSLIFVAGWSTGGGKIELSSQKSSTQKNLPNDLDYKSVEAVYDSLRENYDGELDSEKLLDGLKDGLAQSIGDPYTEYFNLADAKSFDEELNGTFTGIGAELSKEEKSIVIVSPISGFPAEKAGLRPKDVIVEIDGTSAYDISVNEAVKKIRGPKDSKVTLKIVRDSKEELTFEIIRDQITLPSVETKTLDGNIGYIKIGRYSEDTSRLTETAAQSFKTAGVKGVILDLRGDPGGLLDAAVDVSSQWLPAGKIVLEEKRGGETIKQYKSRGDALLAGIPTVVLIDEGSASASEITAGALRDNNAASLVGEKSFGKGSVQQLVNLEDGSVLKVTIARWYTPAGKNIDKEGITPDIVVERTDDDFKNNRDPQLDRAIAELKK